MVLTDILILSKTPKADAITSAIAATVIDEVYKMAAARNGTDRPKFQPTLGHFLDVLKSYHWSGRTESESRRTLPQTQYLSQRPVAQCTDAFRLRH